MYEQSNVNSLMNNMLCAKSNVSTKKISKLNNFSDCKRNMKLIFFSQHFFPENFRINEIVFGLVKKFKINVFTGRPNYHSGNITKKFRAFI